MIMEGFGAKIWGYVVAGGGALLAVLMFWNKAKNSGRKEVQGKVNAATKDKKIEVMENDRKIETDNRSLSGDARRDKLRKYARGRNNK